MRCLKIFLLSPLSRRRFRKKQKKSAIPDEMTRCICGWPLSEIAFCFFFYLGFLHRHWRFTGQQRKGGNHLSFHSTTSTRSLTLRHLFATLHVRWLSRIFNRNVCVYQTATRWDLPPYRITIWVIEWCCNVCLFTWWIDSRFLLHRFDIGNRWVCTRIDYQPYITSEPTNQVCYSPRIAAHKKRLSSKVVFSKKIPYRLMR